MTAALLNLLVNSFFSLLAGLIVVAFFLWFFRMGNGPWKLFLLSLPFAKIVYDFSRGIPKNSVLHTNIDTFNMPPKHHNLTVGADFNYFGPSFDVLFSVKGLGGKFYAESLGDYLSLWLHKNVSSFVPLLILILVGAVSLFLFSVRLFQAWRFERERRADRGSCEMLREIPLRWRRVDVYLSSRFQGTPFTGGIFRPYICIPADAARSLNSEELEAVIAHELGHIRQWDLPVTVLVQLLGDLFWFVPGYRWLSRKIDRLRELVADQWAVSSGIDPAHLASALIKLKEIPGSDRFVLYSAFFREKSLLKARVQRLLGEQERAPRFGWKFRPIRVLASFWIFCAVMSTTFGGNHSAGYGGTTGWLKPYLDKYGIKVD